LKQGAAFVAAFVAAFQKIAGVEFSMTKKLGGNNYEKNI